MPIPRAESTPPFATSRPTRGRRLLKTLRSWILSFALAFAILAPLRSAIADWNDVPTGSMEPTILPGDRIFVNKLAYGLRVPFTHSWMVRWSGPQTGDIVVLDSPRDGTRLVKRVIAGPGDTVELRNNVLVINGQASSYSSLPESNLDTVPARLRTGRIFATERLGIGSHAIEATPTIRGAMRSFPPITVPAGQYFVMGWGVLVCYFELARLLSHRAMRLALLGGFIYSLGAVFHVLRWPVLHPTVFAAHELFHVLVVGGSLAHFWFLLTVVAPYRRPS